MRTIPIVVHVVYNTDEQNISDAQIQSQIDVLNQDFSRSNPDSYQTPSAFKSVAVDTGIQFCLVKTIRKKTNTQIFSNDNAVKFCYSDGSDAMDVTKYMNIWVCNLGDRLLGYTEFPNTQPSNTFGVVMNYGAFGTMGTARSPYDKGRTLTHEMGHALNVLHVFNESVVNSCSKTDHCNDIPSQSKPNFGCPTFPTIDNCTTNPPGIMFMNYMDYVDDSCMNFFTKDQSDRMNAMLNVAPYNTLVSTRCSPNTQMIDCNSSNVVPDNKELLPNWTKYFTTKNIIIGIIIIVIIIGIIMFSKSKK